MIAEMENDWCFYAWPKAGSSPVINYSTPQRAKLIKLSKIE
jgi:hypothetical protein